MKTDKLSFWGIRGVVALFAMAPMLVRPELCHAKSSLGPDSTLIVRNSIRKVRSQSETVVRREERREYDLSDSVPTAIESTVTWKEFDRNGRLLSQVDSLWASDREAIEIIENSYSYSGGRMVAHSVLDRIVIPGKREIKPVTKFVSVTDWNTSYKRVRTEQQESGQWNVQIDSTIFTTVGQPHITYSFNSMRDSFVEEFTYDVKARLKYRRLSMKQFWSPPWEMESTSYVYKEDGVVVVVDSAWRMNPDLAIARAKAGDRSASDFSWRVLICAPTTGTFDRLETRKERTFDTAGRLVLSQVWAQASHMWEEDSWTYNENGLLKRTTQYRGDRIGDHSVYGEPCTDSAWYDYDGKILAEFESKHICNGTVTVNNTIFYDGALLIDPNRVETKNYFGPMQSCVTIRKTYSMDKLQSVVYLDEHNLPIRVESYDSYSNETDTEYLYVHW